MINVLLVEDHILVIEGIKTMLQDTGDINCTGSCTTAAALWPLLQQQQPDLILMDINLPDSTGIDLCKLVKEKYPAVQVLALSINNQPGIISKMMENGASGYVLKDASKSEIIEAVRKAAAGKEFFSHSAAHALRESNAGKLPALTRREKEILEKIADGLTNQQIADQLFVDVTTVNSHRKNMLAKYDVSNTAALVKLAIKENLI